MKARKITVCAMFAATAVAVNAAEGLLPSAVFMPPGAKLGLSNVVTMFAADRSGLGTALAASAVKSLFVLATRGFTAFLMSFCGGLLSTAVCFLLLKKAKRLGYIGTGIIGAVTHNCAQIGIGALFTGSAILSYLPFLAAASLVTGSASGLLLSLTLKYFPERIS